MTPVTGELLWQNVTAPRRPFHSVLRMTQVWSVPVWEAVASQPLPASGVVATVTPADVE